jgi:hypothetical protein
MKNNMRITDRKSLQVDSLLRSSYLDLSKEVGEYSNVIGVFYHQLMIYMTNFIIISHEEREHVADLKFPFLNSDYVETPYPIDFESKKCHSSFKELIYEMAYNFFAKVRKFIASILFIKKKKSIAVSCDLSKREAFSLLFLSLSHEIFYNKQRKIFFKRLDYQISFLYDVMSKVFSTIDIQPNVIAIENFINYVKSHVTDILPACKEDFLLITSPTEITARMQAANYIERSKYVVALIHSQSSPFHYDEPITKYGECSFSTHILVNGKEEAVNSQLCQSLHKSPSKVFYCNSKIVSKIHTSDIISSKPLNHSSKGLYIANVMNYCNQRYGPFRDINSEDYAKWQKDLMSQCLNLFFKGAPKINYDNIVGSDKLLNGKLHQNMKFFRDFDYYILDYFSTGSTLAMATNRPILYFNLGLRNIAEDLISDYKKRMFWVDIDFNFDLSVQIKDGSDRFFANNRTYENNITNRYSLHENSASFSIKKILAEEVN